MPTTAISFGAMLIILGIAGFVGTGSAHPTSLIPAGFGVALALLGFIGLKPAARKHAMHAAATLALVGFVASAVMVGKDLTKAVYSGPALTTKAIMAVLCLVFVALCVRSFISARRQREQVVTPS